MTTWPLITFTILAQMSVGSFIVLAIVHYIAARKAGRDVADQLSDRALLMILIVLALGFVASLFHLGNPFKAYTAVTNFGTSWLSREITFGVAFAVVAAIYILLQWRKIGSAALRNGIALIAGLIGLGLVYCMSNVYMMPTQPAWDTLVTPIAFYTTTLLLGTLALAASFMLTYFALMKKEGGCSEEFCVFLRQVMKALAVAAVILIGIEMVITPLYAARVASIDADEGFISEFGLLFAIRLALGFIGAGVFGLFLYQTANVAGREKALANIAYLAFGFVFVAEVLNRFLFYATQIQPGI